MKDFKQKMIDFDIVGKHKIWYLIPVIVLLTAAIVFSVFAYRGGSAASGMNIGIDFTGGTLITVTLGEGAEGAEYAKNVQILKGILEKHGCELGQDQKSSGSDREKSSIDIRFRNPIDGTETNSEGQTINELVDAIKADIAAAFSTATDVKDPNDPNFITSTTIGKTASAKLLKSALLASLLSILLILVYIVIRFELWSGVVAVLTMLHDVLIMVALTVIFRIQVNTSFVAAVVTIIAYSINNTIVVFDRIRENTRTYDDKNRIPYADIANKAVANTFTRTLLTSLTTFITVFFLAVLGVATMREFTIPIMFGLIAGMFSCVFLAGSSWALINESLKTRRLKAKQSFKRK